MIERLDYPKANIRLHITSEPERQMRIRSCDKEPETVEWIESLRPGTFFDIGANVGAYSFVAAACGHKVYAFEPPGPTFDRLEQNIGLNDELRVFAYDVLLGDENGPVDFSLSSLEPGAALHTLGAGGDHVVRVQMSTLDVVVQRLNLPYPDYLKIDTDGSELRVLLGAQVCLSHVKSLQVETDDTLPMSQQVEPFLAERGFDLTSSTRHGDGPICNVRFDRG